MTEYDVVLENVSKKFEHRYAVKDFNLKIRKGEYITFLGPSGCGKTVTLRIIAGHEEMTMGNVYIRNRLVNHLPPGQRETALMFQNFALFPHMNVWLNVEFGLIVKHVEPTKRKEMVKDMLTTMGLDDLAHRKPAELSGGQQQRVALARALVTKPAVLLLDEPLGSLDEILRVRLRGELKNLQKNMGLTFIHVTHNQEECLTMGDVLVVIKDGLIEQIGTPQEIFTSPETLFVASFVGENFILEGEITSVDETLVSIQTKTGLFKVDTERKPPPRGERAGFSIRADLISITEESCESFDNQLTGVVIFVEYEGYIVKLRIKLESGDEVIVKETQGAYFQRKYTEGDKIGIGWNAKDAIFLS